MRPLVCLLVRWAGVAENSKSPGGFNVMISDRTSAHYIKIPDFHNGHAIVPKSPILSMGGYSLLSMRNLDTLVAHSSELRRNHRYRNEDESIMAYSIW